MLLVLLVVVKIGLGGYGIKCIKKSFYFILEDHHIIDILITGNLNG